MEKRPSLEDVINQHEKISSLFIGALHTALEIRASLEDEAKRLHWDKENITRATFEKEQIDVMVSHLGGPHDITDYIPGWEDFCNLHFTENVSLTLDEIVLAIHTHINNAIGVALVDDFYRKSGEDNA